MTRRSNLLVILGLAFLVIGGIIVFALTDDDDGDTAAAEVPVVVGSDDIAAGELGSDLLEQGRLREVRIPAERLVAGAIQSTAQLEGATFVQGFAADQQITAAGVQSQNRTFDIPDGYEAVAVQLDFVSGGAGYVNPGDRLNLYGLLRTAPPDVLTPRAELLLTNVEVLDVNLTIPARRGTASGTSDASASPSVRATSDTVTYLLALRTVDAEKVIYTTEYEALYASLTRKDAPPVGPTTGRDGASILAEEPDVAANR